jgi:hypothetical protein
MCADGAAVPLDVAGVAEEPVVDEDDAMPPHDVEEPRAVEIKALVSAQPNEPDVEATSLQQVEQVVCSSCEAIGQCAPARERW